jgi:CRP-like cAMP-binding protein
MDDLNFSEAMPVRVEGAVASGIQIAAPGALYNPALALDFFRSSGTVEQVQKGKLFFKESEKSNGLFATGDKMYLLLDGEVGMMLNEKFFGIVKQGEIFGELAVIAGLPRSASAMAMTDCRVLSLDKKQFQTALRKTPEFALMLMGIMTQRLRKSMTSLADKAPLAANVSMERGRVFNKGMLAKLSKELNGQLSLSVNAGQVIINMGAVAAFMYIVREGCIEISIGNQAVELVGPGGFFGEMALLDNAPRSAAATAKTDCSLLSIGRNDFLGLVKENPDFSVALLKSIAVRMQHLTQQVARLTSVAPSSQDAV